MRTLNHGSLVLFLTLTTSTVFGQVPDPNYQLYVGDRIALAGDTFESPVYLDNTSAGLVQAHQFGICYDPLRLEVLDVTIGSVLSSPPWFEQYNFNLTSWDAFALYEAAGTTVIPPGLGLELAHATYLVVGTGSTSLCPCETISSPDPAGPLVTVDGESIYTTNSCGFVTGAPLMATDDVVIFAGEEPGGAIDSVTALRIALETNSQSVLVTEVLSPSYFSDPKAVFACLGTFPDNHVLTDSEGNFLKDLIVAGVPVYVEGNDVWGFDPPTPFSEYDGIDPAAADGDDSFHGMVGESYAAVSLLGFTASYSQDQLFSSDFTDRLIPSALDGAGPNSGVIWRDDGSGGSTAAYGTAVFYDTSAGHGKVLSQSWEFGGYGSSQSVLIAKYLLALEVVGQAFERGDANIDGSVNIGDVLFTLDRIFGVVSGSFACEDAADANDDGMIDLADAVTLLTFLFSGGAPLPPPSCAIDPTPDSLGCVSGTPCLF